ncbi:YybS family protein [Lederbergia sp. NSJ-179]|uniref:YybS family protein n=1 Tax=Lederbergia sp. NSJ-179 TaxID=2931402 RepID=UPI001FD57DDD|nr:YybS family protein [Lederbergia sp. NSJ-179]MCJ7842854.1 YybS family protein [Lederbergia sp. NSJ-179]
MGNARVLKEGAMLLAIFFIMLGVAVFVPFTSIIIQFVFILPFVLFSARHPMKYLIPFFVITFIVSFFIGSYIGMTIAFLYGVTGLVMGYGIQKRESKGNIYIASSIAFLFGLLLLLIVAAMIFHLNFIDEYQQMFKDTVDQYMDALASLGQTPSMEIQEQLINMGNLIGSMAPTILAGAAFVTVLILMAVNFPIVRRLGVTVPKFKAFRHVNFPKAIVWVYLVVLLFSFFITEDSSSFFQMVILNATFLLQILLVIQGLSFVFYFAHMKKWVKIIPIFVVILTIMLPFLLSIISVLGIIDIGFSLRQRINNKV